MKENLEFVKLQVSELEENKEESILDLDLELNDESQNKKPKIVKVIKSSAYKASDL